MDATTQGLINAIRERAKESPDTTYHHCYDYDHPCSYFYGQCSDGSTGCIVGQALDSLRVRKKSHEGRTVEHVVRKSLGWQAELIQTDWLRAVQDAQDVGDSWGKAVGKADADCPQPTLSTA